MKGRLYRLQCRLTGKFYIGSTTTTPAYRLKKHRAASKELHRQESPLYTHFRTVGCTNTELVVLAEFEVETRRALLEIEKKEILVHIGTSLCLNHNRPLITAEEKKTRDAEYGKERRANNKERELERVKRWREANPDKYEAQKKRSSQRQKEARIDPHCYSPRRFS